MEGRFFLKIRSFENFFFKALESESARAFKKSYLLFKLSNSKNSNFDLFFSLFSFDLELKSSEITLAVEERACLISSRYVLSASSSVSLFLFRLPNLWTSEQMSHGFVLSSVARRSCPLLVR